MTAAPTIYNPKEAPWPVWAGEERWEQLIPNGFVHDFVAHLRGTETATSFSVWSAISLVAATVRRNAWFEWFPDPLYPQFYIFLVAPPGRVMKGNPIKVIRRVGRGFHEHIDDPLVQLEKEMNLYSGAATPESLHELLQPEERWHRSKHDDGRGKVIRIDRGSQIYLVESELSTFLGKQQYNVGLVQKLTDLYDGNDDSGERYTKKEKMQKLRNISVNLIAATTPGDLSNSIPREAFGGGLMSRIVIVFEGKGRRVYDAPFLYNGAPRAEDLMRKLGWIAHYQRGRHDFSEQAAEFFHEWYKQFKLRLNMSDEQQSLSISRQPTILRQLALTIRLQRYEQTDGRVTLDDLMLAKDILDETYSRSAGAVDEIDQDISVRKRDRVGRYIQRSGRDGIRRQTLIQRISRYLKVEDVNFALSHYLESGEIEVWEDGEKKTRWSRRGDEIYSWVGGDWDA